MNTARRKAFSLVEVVLAIGIITFAITAMIGLLSVAMQSDKSSSSDTALVAMSRQVFNSLRAMPYASLPSSTNYHFDSEGSECIPSQAVYKCTATLGADPELAGVNLKRLQMRFEWAGNTNVIYGAIANYGY